MESRRTCVEPNAQAGLFIIFIVIFYVLLFYFFFYRRRGWNRRARVQRPLLVNEDGQYVWRTVKGRVLVGWCDSNGEITSGFWGKPADPDSEDWHVDWAVIESKKKLIAYRFHKRVENEPKTGDIYICNSWRELEELVPLNILEEALLAAGIKKPGEYRKMPLKL